MTGLVNAALPVLAAVPGGLLAGVLVLPLAGVAVFLLISARTAERVALALLGAGVLIALLVAASVWTQGRPLVTFIGGHAPPLGVALRAGGFSCAMLVMAAVVLFATALFARTPRGAATARMPPAFWMLALSAASALNLAFLAEDLFTLYVALELLTFAAVPLVCLDGKRGQMEAALTYLMFALAGSVLYLLGAVLVYGLTGTLDIALAAARLPAFGLGTAAVLALMTAGLAAKAALFPLYLWLPPAHAGAAPAASALLSAAVIKAPLFLMVRLWADLAPAPLAATVAPVLALLGAGAIVFCGLMALAQGRLKLLIAYSTAAQIGYLFLMFPLAAPGEEALAYWSAVAWTGGALHLVSHAFSKAAMFMAAGLIAEAAGHDRLDGLSGIGRAAPVSVAAFTLGGLSLMGLPPSGGFVAKVMLLTAAVQQSAWWIALVILAGGLLAGGYVLKVTVIALRRPDACAAPVARECAWRSAIALALAFGAVLLGFLPLTPLSLLAIGRPLSWEGLLP